MRKLSLFTVILTSALLFTACHKHSFYKSINPDTGQCNLYRCRDCEETSSEEHDWGEWKHVNASCEEKEMNVRTCKNCGYEDCEVISEELGHKYGELKVVSKADCTHGEIKKSVCSVCGKEQKEETEPLGHVPGNWEITKQATYDSKGKRQRICKRCGKVVDSEKYSLTQKEKKQYLHEHCQNYSYETIARYPNKYKGKYAKFTGEVVQVIDKETYRVDVTYEGYGFYTDTIYVELSDDVNLDFNILEDDIITIYGVLAGECSYETVLGADMTIPAFTAYEISVK